MESLNGTLNRIEAICEEVKENMETRHDYDGKTSMERTIENMSESIDQNHTEHKNLMENMISEQRDTNTLISETNVSLKSMITELKTMNRILAMQTTFTYESNNLDGTESTFLNDLRKGNNA
jgi:hypothetical protein